MAGTLRIKRGIVDATQLEGGEFYVRTDACKVQIGTQNGAIISLVPLNCSVAGNITLTGTISATSFVGSLTGNVTGDLTGNASTATTATNANNVSVQSAAGSGPYYIAFASTTGNTPIYVNTSGISYNPSTDTLTVGNIIGTFSGTTTNATNTTNVAITNTATDNGTYYLTFVDGINGNRTLRVDDSTLTYNPSTNIINATASYATTAGTVAGSVFTSSNPALSASYAASSSNAGYSITSSYSTSASWSDNSGNSKTSDTASYIGNALYTASATLNTIKFTKGDGSEFNITIDTGSVLSNQLLTGTTNGQILYNNNGSFGSLSQIFWNGSTVIVTGSFNGNVTE